MQQDNKCIHTSTRWSAISLGIFSTNNSITLRISDLARMSTEFCIWECCDCVVCCIALNLATSFAIVIINAGGRAVAMSDRACLAVLQASAAGDKGKPKVMLQNIHFALVICLCSNTYVTEKKFILQRTLLAIDIDKSMVFIVTGKSPISPKLKLKRSYFLNIEC